MPRLLAALPFFALAACAGVSPPVESAAASTPATASLPASMLDLRIEQLVPGLKGDLPPENFFSESFLAAVPPAKFKELSNQLIAQFGQPLRIAEIRKSGPGTATVIVAYEKALGTIDIGVSDTSNAKVSTLLLKGFALTNDSFAKIDADFAALPGRAAYVVQELKTDGSAATITARNATEQFAIGSSFKLYILAELASQIEAGERRWTDVAPLSHRSISSAGTNNWPKDSPATLHSLATWMISVSDNSATDTLLHLLGRSRVEQKLALIGHSNPDKALPILSTVEAFALKSGPGTALRERYLKADEAGQRSLLDSNEFTYDPKVSNPFADGPAFIDSLEWFASPEDLGRLMNNIRRTGSQSMLDIMTVNKGASPSAASKWQYLGYKGGSEPGVISMTYLGQTPSGKWMVISGSWNNSAKVVDDGDFAALMARLLDQAVK